MNRRKVLAYAGCYLLLKRNKKKIWMKEWLKNKNKGYAGEDGILTELLQCDADSFKNFCRLTKEQVKYIYSLIKSKISSKNTKFREAISPLLKFMVTLRFLATGKSDF